MKSNLIFEKDGFGTVQIYHTCNDGVPVGRLLMDVDGFFYYWPSMNLSGCYASYILHEIADTLDELNREWEEQLERDFNKEQ